MNRYTENFTLKDIFNNDELKYRLPLVNYREYNVVTREGSSVSVKTQMKTVKRQIFETATNVAKYYYKPLKVEKREDEIAFSGNLIYDQEACVDQIVSMLQAYKPMLEFSANNGDIIRSALKENEKGKRKYGIDCKLFLREQSMMEIKGKTKKQMKEFMEDIMGNILFSDNYPETQKKYKVSEQDYGRKSYADMRAEWRRKVGLE